MHEQHEGEKAFVHRNLTPETIYVRFDDSPIFSGFHLARVWEDRTVDGHVPSEEWWNKTAAPEVKNAGLQLADKRSDIYSLCETLKILFTDCHDNNELVQKALRLLEKGTQEKPEDRVRVEELCEDFNKLIAASTPPSTTESEPGDLPPARYWSEDQVVRFNKHEYRIVSRLGSGGLGTAFKVVQINPKNDDEDLGTFVAKIAHDRSTGEQVLNGYKLARAHVGRHPNLSPIYEVADDWKENGFVALLSWIEGAPLKDYIGVFPLLAEELNAENPEKLAIQWLKEIIDALDQLHQNGIIHGDVSPGNIILSKGSPVLTDYDFVTKIKDFAKCATKMYCSPSYLTASEATPSDDYYALAAAFFHILYDKEPFDYKGEINKNAGLNWDSTDPSVYSRIRQFLDKATNPDRMSRIHSKEEALRMLGIGEVEKPAVETEVVTHQPMKIDWLRNVLQSYPGALIGNRETRGLDSDFAVDTYVETGLENALIQGINEGKIRLVILCGNAGDGKTALLQYIAKDLGLDKQESSERIIKGKTNQGTRVYINLDGSADWNNRTSNQLLDEFFEPFQHGPPQENICHLLAINDGRLMEWLEENDENSPLTEEIYSLLEKGDSVHRGYIYFINLNTRSLVGGISATERCIRTDFVNRVIDRLYGNEKTEQIWKPCLRCSSKSLCRIFQAATVFAPDSFPEKAEPQVRQRARERLIEALQAVHMRGEIHITARELRATLVYILFGIHYCDDYHAQVTPTPEPYWDKAFDISSAGRQGELLRELARFDPALESHPKIDRFLLSKTHDERHIYPPSYSHEGLSLASARRRAYFEWLPNDILQVAGDNDALTLAKGKYYALFRDIVFKNGAEKKEIRNHLCNGIARLEYLPPNAYTYKKESIPLHITPRTPTETAFWVEKSLESFELQPDLPEPLPGMYILHRQINLIYTYKNGRKERLRINADLFHQLIELSEGYQLGDISSDDTFSHLSIFVQRLVQEDDREILAWTPIEDESVFRVYIANEQTTKDIEQILRIEKINLGLSP